MVYFTLINRNSNFLFGQIKNYRVTPTSPSRAHLKSISKSCWFYLQNRSRIKPPIMTTTLLPSLGHCYLLQRLLQGLLLDSLPPPCIPQSVVTQQPEWSSKATRQTCFPCYPFAGKPAMASHLTWNKSQSVCYALQSPTWLGLTISLIYLLTLFRIWKEDKMVPSLFTKKNIKQ